MGLREDLQESERRIARKRAEALKARGIAGLLRNLLAEIDGEEGKPHRLPSGEAVNREEFEREWSRIWTKRSDLPPELRPPLIAPEAPPAPAPAARPAQPDDGLPDISPWAFTVEREASGLAKRIVGRSADGAELVMDLKRNFADGLLSGLTFASPDGGPVYDVTMQRGHDGLMAGFSMKPVEQKA